MIKLSHTIKRLGQAALCVLSIASTHQSMAAGSFIDTVDHSNYNCVDFNGGKGDAAARAQAQYGGKVLSVSTVKREGQVIYKVKLLLDSGRIKIVSIKGR